MREQSLARRILCKEYQALLEEADRARKRWDQRRSEICRVHLVGKETGDELLRLQANYARAYTLLRTHMHTCFRCRIVSRIA
jgi:hypothetical protein